MGRAVKGILIGAAIIGVGVLTGGIGFVPGTAAFSAGGVAVAGTAATLSTTAIGGMLLAAGLTQIASGLGTALMGQPRVGLTAFDPKAINIDKSAPRKLVFGQGLFPLDLRYAEPSGKDDEYVDYIFALAGHKSEAVDTLYIEEKRAWTASGGAEGDFSGFLWIETRLNAGPGAYHTVNSGSKWGAKQRMTGCTTMKVRIKRSKNGKTESPFAGGISGRWSLIGKGMPVYSPARDSTMPGGSGTQRADDCTTWAYAVGPFEQGNNPALQLLAYLLGWKVNGVGSVGLGIDPSLIDLASFAAAAAVCDESVALSGGGYQRRYEAGGVFSDADDPSGVIQQLLDAMNGELVDDGEGIALRIGTADLTPVAIFTADDFLSGYNWNPEPPLPQQITVVRGRFTQPGPPALWSMTDYPEVATGRPSVAPRPLSFDLPMVQDIRRAERIATQVARRSMHSGMLEVTVGIRGWLLRQNMVVGISLPERGWAPKLFRVRGIRLNIDADDASGRASATLMLREETASIYSWATSETGNVAPVDPIPFAGGIGRVGADGLSIAAVPAVINVGLLPSGSPRAGELPKTTQIILYDGQADVTPDATYSVLEATNCTAAHVAGGQFRLSAVTGLPASFVVLADYNGRSISQEISVATPKDGAGAIRASASTSAPASTGTLSQVGVVDLAVPAGATITASGSMIYRAASGVGAIRTVTLAAAISIENFTDAGSPVFGAEQVGSEAVFVVGDGDSEAGSLGASFSVTNSAGTQKTFRCRFYTRKVAGNSTARTAPGDYFGLIEASAA